jgi:hypothetical protein
MRSLDSGGLFFSLIRNKSERAFKALPCSVILGIWLSRNYIIF